MHAGVGADILSAIDFPYPVVPIVRHHHENWDGTGYPTGIRGTDIPIGARDPLRRRLLRRPHFGSSIQATTDRMRSAIAILLERRGTMYDPLVVDTFIRVHGHLRPLSLQEPREAP